ncbi:hypothetical protein NMY22_g5277 [Coprinellus aureogranulatus]|nr:hypothetical protein NMY22_g5277 [Coprinellus aureogranulatus]
MEAKRGCSRDFNVTAQRAVARVRQAAILLQWYFTLFSLFTGKRSPCSPARDLVISNGDPTHRSSRPTLGFSHISVFKASSMLKPWAVDFPGRWSPPPHMKIIYWHIHGVSSPQVLWVTKRLGVFINFMVRILPQAAQLADGCSPRPDESASMRFILRIFLVMRSCQFDNIWPGIGGSARLNVNKTPIGMSFRNVMIYLTGSFSLPFSLIAAVMLTLLGPGPPVCPSKRRYHEPVITGKPLQVFDQAGVNDFGICLFGSTHLKETQPAE